MHMQQALLATNGNFRPGKRERWDFTNWYQVDRGRLCLVLLFRKLRKGKEEGSWLVSVQFGHTFAKLLFLHVWLGK